LYSAVLYKRFRDFILGGSVFPVAISRFAVCRAARRILVESSKFCRLASTGWMAARCAAVAATAAMQRSSAEEGAHRRKEAGELILS